jgi:hypothetical protein
MTFSQAITDLAASDITLSGISDITMGALSGLGPSYTLPISSFTAGGTLNVNVTKSGYNISGSPKTVTVYYSIPVTFSGVTQNGSSSQITTELILSFSDPIPGLSATDITLSGINGVNKGTLTGDNPYTLPISGFTTGGNLTVAVAKSGFTISGSPKTVAIIFPVAFSSVTANGSSSQATTELTLSFSVPIYGLNSSDITFSGIDDVIKGTLMGSNPYTLPSVTTGGSLTVAVAKSGFTISNSTRTVTIYPPDSIIPVTFSSVTANGSASQTTTELTLSFSVPISGLSASDIILSGINGVTKGTLTGNNPYTIPISFNIGGTLTVAFAKTGFIVSDSPKTVTIHYVHIPANLTSYLTNLLANTASSPHNIILNISSPGEFSTIRNALNGAQNKYVYLDLTGSSITSIPDYAFNTGSPSYMGCSTLSGITIPDGVTSIGSESFYECSGLVSVTIPDSVNSIGHGAFGFCENLASIKIPNGITSIESFTFCQTSLTSVIIPDSVISIGESAFSSCRSLTNVTFLGTIPSSGFYSGISYLGVFPGDLREKFYATESTNGTPGTYKTTNPGFNPTWTLQ